MKFGTKSKTQDVKVDGKIVGKLDPKSNNLAYFHSTTPDSPLSNLYVPEKGFNLYYKNGKFAAENAKDARKFHFSSVEQVFAFGKALTMKDKETARDTYMIKPEIAQKDPAIFRRLGRSVKHFDSTKWDKMADKWMKLGMKAKFEQDDFSKRTLKAVQNYNLVEANPYDRTWGIGRGVTDDFSTYKGQNKQGENLMDVARKLGLRPQIQKTMQASQKQTDQVQSKQIMQNKSQPASQVKQDNSATLQNSKLSAQNDVPNNDVQLPSVDESELASEDTSTFNDPYSY